MGREETNGEKEKSVQKKWTRTEKKIEKSR